MSAINEGGLDREKLQANMTTSSDSGVFHEKNLFKEASVESIADNFKLKKQQLYKLVMGKKFKSGKVVR